MEMTQQKYVPIERIYFKENYWSKNTPDLFLINHKRVFNYWMKNLIKVTGREIIFLTLRESKKVCDLCRNNFNIDKYFLGAIIDHGEDHIC